MKKNTLSIVASFMLLTSPSYINASTAANHAAFLGNLTKTQPAGKTGLNAFVLPHSAETNTKKTDTNLPVRQTTVSQQPQKQLPVLKVNTSQQKPTVSTTQNAKITNSEKPTATVANSKKRKPKVQEQIPTNNKPTISNTAASNDSSNNTKTTKKVIHR